MLVDLLYFLRVVYTKVSYGIPCGNCFLTIPSMTYVKKKILAQTKVFTNLLTIVIGVPVSPR